MIRNEFVNEIMDRIAKYISPEFGINVDYDETSSDLEAIRTFIYDNYKAEVYNGVTKCVIVFDNEDEVIKLPFNGKFEEWYDDAEDEYKIDFTAFEYANTDVEDASTTWDYCENEYIKYEKAVEDGFAEFLLATRYHGMICGMPVYTQERAETFYDSEYISKTAPSEKAIKEYEKMGYAPMNRDWVVRAIDYYGIRKVVDFIQWAKSNGLTGDLHSGNIGFTTEGRPIILDWAGYRE